MLLAHLPQLPWPEGLRHHPEGRSFTSILGKVMEQLILKVINKQVEEAQEVWAG